MSQKQPGPKNPRVPAFPPQVIPLVNLLHHIIDEELHGNLERRGLAMGLLTRLSVVWLQPPSGWPKVQVDYDAKTGLLHFDNELVKDIVEVTTKLFPDGEGLPQHGVGAL